MFLSPGVVSGNVPLPTVIKQLNKEFVFVLQKTINRIREASKR